MLLCNPSWYEYWDASWALLWLEGTVWLQSELFICNPEISSEDTFKSLILQPKIVQFSITEMSKHLRANTFTISAFLCYFHTEKNEPFKAVQRLSTELIEWLSLTDLCLTLILLFANSQAGVRLSLRTVPNTIKIYNTVVHVIVFHDMLTAVTSLTWTVELLWVFSNSWASRSWAAHAPLSCTPGSIHSVWGRLRNTDILWEGRFSLYANIEFKAAAIDFWRNKTSCKHTMAYYITERVTL